MALSIFPLKKWPNYWALSGIRFDLYGVAHVRRWGPGRVQLQRGRWEGSPLCSIRGVKPHIKLVSHCKFGTKTNLRMYDAPERVHPHSLCKRRRAGHVSRRLFDYNAGTGQLSSKKSFPFEFWLMDGIFLRPSQWLMRNYLSGPWHNKTWFPQYTPTWTN